MKKYIVTIIILVISCSLNAQSQLQFYTMNRVVQSSFINPAADIPYGGHVGGLLIPIFGQLPPSTYFNVRNSAFAYNDLFHFGKGIKSDDLILDLDEFMKEFKQAKYDNIRFNTHLELLTIGFKGRKTKAFWTINLTEKINFGASVPYDFFNLLLNGNAEYMREGKPQDFSRSAISATAYLEFGVGASFPLNDKLRMGARGKLLWGQANIETQINKLTLNTIENEGYVMQFDADASIRSSMPLLLTGAIFTKDSIDAEFNDELTSKEYLLSNLKFKNMGAAFDIGFQYKPIDKVKVFGSISDLGFIRWNNQAQQLHSKGQYDFYGVEIKPVEPFDSTKYSSQFDAIGDRLLDTLVSTFLPEFSDDKSYTSMIPLNIYIGGEYEVNKMLQVGLLYRGDYHKKNYSQSGTIYLNAPLTNWVSLHASYTIANYTFNNIGAGLTLRGGPFLWYFSCDNVIGAIWPQKARMVNLRMGLNILFNYKDKVNKPRFKAY